MQRTRSRKLNKRVCRITALVLVFCLLVGGLPLLPATRVMATPVSDVRTLLCQLVRDNLSGAEKLNELTDDKIWEIFLDEMGKGKASAVVLKDVLEECADEASGDFNISDATAYGGAQMTKSYNMGNLIVDYERIENNNAALLKDADIVELYDGLAEADPNVSMDSLNGAIASAAGKSGGGIYSDANYMDTVNKKDMVTYYQWTQQKKNVVPSGTLFIGTYLIDMRVLNDTFYQFAQDSMSANEQQIMLYKSELDSNRWKDIMSAGSLDDLLPVGEFVEEADLMKYYISCVIGSDGIPRNPKNGNVMNIFDVSNPYEMEQIPEFKPLKMLFDGGVVSVNSDDLSGSFTWYRLNDFWNFDRKRDRKQITKADIDAVVETSKYNMLFYNLLYNANDYRGKGDAFVDCLWLWYAWGGRRHPKLFGNDDRLDDYYGFWFSWNSRYTSRNAIPIIRGAIRWTDEKKFWNKWKNKWGTYQQHIWDFMDWRYCMYDTRDDVTDRSDRELKNLDQMFRRVQDGGDQDTASVLMTLMTKVDATRRAEVYYNLVENENNNLGLGPALLHLIETCRDGKTKIGDNFRYHMQTQDDFTPDSSVVSALDEALSNCQESYQKYASRSLMDGETVLSHREYELSRRIIDASNKGTGNNIRNDAATLYDVYCIEDDSIEHRSRELDEINTLLPRARSAFSEKIHDTVSDDYLKAQDNPNATEATLKPYLEDQKAEATGQAVGLQKLIKARCLRVNGTQGEAFVNSCLDWAESQNSGITSDPYGTYASEALGDHIQWLKDILRKVKAGTLDSDEEAETTTFLAQYQKEVLDALDNDDIEALEAADRRLEEELAKEVEGSSAKSRSTETNEQNEISDDEEGGSTESTPEGGGTNGDPGKFGQGQNPVPKPRPSTPDTPGPPDVDNEGDEITIEDFKGPDRIISKVESNVMEAVEDDDSEGMIRGIEALGELGESKDKFDQLEKSLKAHDADETVMQALKKARDTAEESGLNDGNTKQAAAESGTDTGGKTEKTKNVGLNDEQRELMDSIGGEALGTTSIPELPDDDKAALVAACMQFGTQRGNQMVLDYAKTVTDAAVAENNTFFYHIFSADPGTEYVSLAAVDRGRSNTFYRYVRRGDKVTMSQIAGGTEVYSFFVGKDTVTKSDGSTATLKTNTVQQRDVYIRGARDKKYAYITEEDSQGLMDIYCEYVTDTQWAVYVIPSMEKKIAKITKLLEEILDASGSETSEEPEQKTE